MKISLLLILLISSMLCAKTPPREFDSDITKWSIVPPPAKNTEDFYSRANSCETEWQVSQINGKPSAAIYDEFILPKTPVTFNTTVLINAKKAHPIQMIQVDDGWIAGYNRGEFGAAIYWFSPDGKSKRLLSNHQFNNIIQDQGRYFIAEGLAHLDMSDGSILELTKVDNLWQVETFLKTPKSVEGITKIRDGEFAIISFDSIIRFNLKKESTILASNSHWPYLYPNSITSDSKHIYVGMRQFVMKCKLSSTQQEQAFDFLVPSLKWLNTIKDN